MNLPIVDGMWRMIDASLNRAAEGLRTVEEVLRFCLEDAAGSQQFKTLRHDLAAVAATLPRTQLLAHRDTAGDVGTDNQTVAEYQRVGLADVVAAANARTSQSLRVIEELCKTELCTELNSNAAAVEAIRYRFYDLAAAAELRLSRSNRVQRLAKCRLYGIVTAGADEHCFEQRVQRLYDNGVDILQLRDRSVSDRVLFQRSVIGTRIAAQCERLFIVNDRADIAAAAGADGVHLGQDELPVKAARRIVGHDRLVGLSTHKLAQVQGDDACLADYIGCGPIYASRTKSFDEHTGPAWLGDVAALYPKPAFAIGGIDAENGSQVLETGIHGIAVAAALDGNLQRLVSLISDRARA